MTTCRALGLAVVLLSILVFPYWIYVPVLFIAILFFPFFWEGVLFAFLIEILYGNGIGNFSSIILLSAFYVLIFLIILLPIRERLRTYV